MTVDNRLRRRLLQQVGRASFLTLALAGLGACNATLGGDAPAADAIGYRQARSEGIQAMQQYHSCVDEAVTLDKLAREARSPAKYLASARLLERCEADLGTHAGEVPIDERIRAYGLVVQNHLKGGDLQQAQAAFERFTGTFGGYDLYYTDGSSFTDTMQVLLGVSDERTQGRLASLNVSLELKDELRRMTHWSRN